MRFTATSESISFLGATGCTRPRPLSPRLGGSSPLVPMAAVVGVAGVGAGSVAGVATGAIGATVSAVTVSASAAASASKQDTVASQFVNSYRKQIL